jgi:hypothetical protein
MKVSPLEVLITRACEPSLHEPNYALHLEVAEYINQKKANKCVDLSPRQSYVSITDHIHHFLSSVFASVYGLRSCSAHEKQQWLSQD